MKTLNIGAHVVPTENDAADLGSSTKKWRKIYGTATSVEQNVTFNNSGNGNDSGTTYNGSTARTISYNTIGAFPKTGGTITGEVTINGALHAEDMLYADGAQVGSLIVNGNTSIVSDVAIGGALTLGTKLADAYIASAATWNNKQNKIDPVTDTASGYVSTVSQTNGQITVGHTQFPIMTGASASADGASGFVPQSKKGEQSKFLRGDGTWQAVVTSQTQLSKGNDATGTSGINYVSDISVSNHAITLTKSNIREFTAASASADGTSGIVPAPTKGQQSYFLRGDKTWHQITASDVGAATSGHNHDSVYLKLSGGTVTSTLELKAGAYKADQSNSYSGGAYQAVSEPNIRMIGNSTNGISTIEFISQKGDTSINRPSDCAYIQFQPYGTSALSAAGTNPTLNTSGEVNRLIIGVNNDANDQVFLQTPGSDGLKHIVNTATYTIPGLNGTTTTANYPIISTTTSGVYTHNTSVTMNGGTITATTFSGNLTGDVTGKINNFTIGASVPSNAVFTDTKNTAGTTASNSKLYLVGATSQAANPQTYSNSAVYAEAGVLNATSFTVNTVAKIQYNSSTGCLEIIT